MMMEEEEEYRMGGRCYLLPAHVGELLDSRACCGAAVDLE